MNWLYYLLEANFYLVLFYALYWLLLRNVTFYSANRWYLLVSCGLAFTLPFLQLGFLKPAEVFTQTVIISNAETANTAPNITPNTDAAIEFDWQSIVLIIYVAGVVISALLLAIKLLKLYLIIGKSDKKTFGGYQLIESADHNTGFSFFNYLFIGKSLEDKSTIITHELVHIQQKHSADIVFIELIKIISWFNPLLHLLQNSLKTIHEYIADEQTAVYNGGPLSYSTFLLNNACGVQGPAATNSFFNYSLLKNRIIMLNKPRSGSSARLKYLMIVPLTGGMLCLSTLTFSKSYKTFDLLGSENNTVDMAPVTQADVHPIDTGLTFPEPDVVRNDFTHLTKYLTRHIKYPKSMFEKQATAGMIISFNVNAAGATTNAKLIGKHTGEMEAAALKAISSYPGGLRVKPGNYMVGVKFVTLSKKTGQFAPPELTKKPNFIGTVTVVGLSDKQASDLKALAETPPNVDTPDNSENVKPAQEATADELDQFYKYVARHARYPTVDYNNKVTGRVFVKIITDNEAKIKDAVAIKWPSETLRDEAVRAIKTYEGKLSKANTFYMVPVAYALSSGEKNDKYLLSDKNIAVDNNANGITFSTESYQTLREIVITGFLKED